jgi:DNA-binding NtrC family response regulator
MNKPSILVIDDRDDICLSARFVLEDNNYQVMEVSNPHQAKILLTESKPDLILLDMNYSLDTTSGEEGLAFLSWLTEMEYGIPVVAMTAWSNVSLAVQAMKLGAGDFIEKPWKNQRLLQIVQQQLTLADLKIQNQKLQQRLESFPESEYIWCSGCMLDLMQQVERVAGTDVAILLTGSNGTGKSRLARFIHEISARKNAPFISVNMGGIAESLFESEMFGHKKGAFTDAKNNRIGRFELAKHGTLFLDEIANIPLSQQMKLLRVVETGEYEVLGTSHTIQTNVRIISATNGDMSSLIGNEKFREDLFYRLNTLEFRLPSLSERSDDIIPLAEHFLKTYTKKYQRDSLVLSSSVKRELLGYAWPGNIRELSHLVQRMVLLTSGKEVSVSGLEKAEKKFQPVYPDEQILPQVTLEQAEKKMIQQALISSNNNIPKAAALLGLTKSSLYRRLEKYDDIEIQKP